jgi:DNA repair protein RadC
MDAKLETQTNKELLSAISGVKQAESLVQSFTNLNEMAQASLDELSMVSGVGFSKAKAIKSAFLLANRLTRESYGEKPLLDTPEKVASMLREENRLYRVETFQVVLLNTRRRMIAVERISEGTLDTVLVHPREVFQRAITKRASAIVLVHNHPSGNPSPSEADIKVTRDLIRAGNLIKIEVLDHIILGTKTVEQPQDFVSLRELGYFYA